MRRENGSEAPYGVTFWCLGNEMDGPWQIGHKTATEYGRLAAETARAMRMVGGADLRLAACGSSSPAMETFGEWERTVLTETYDLVDYISAHQYFENFGVLEDHLAAGALMEQFIRDITAHIDHVKSVKKSSRDVHISFDEWNVWHGHQPTTPAPTGDDWPKAPKLLEDVYTVADAIVIGDLLITLLANSDRVHSASLAQLVNAIAPIMTAPGGQAWKQTTFHPFALTSAHAKGEVLRIAVDSPSFLSPKHGEVAALSAVVTHDAESGQLTIFAVNRHTSDDLTLGVDLRSFEGMEMIEATTYTNEDPMWKATESDSTSVLPKALEETSLATQRLKAVLLPVSWSMFRLG